MGKKKTEQGLTAPNCPVCGEWMDKVDAWVCKKCGKLKELKKK